MGQVSFVNSSWMALFLLFLQTLGMGRYKQRYKLLLSF